MAGENHEGRFGYWKEIIGGVLVSAVLFLGAKYFENDAAETANTPEIVESFRARLTEVEGQLREAQSRILSLTLQNAELTNAIGGELKEVQMSGVFAYIDGIERPAWCKEVEYNPGEKIKFRMRYLNYAYEQAHGISVQKYIGTTDFENYPASVAQSYYNNDLRTYRAKDYFEYEEPLVEEGEAGDSVLFAKFYVAMPSGAQLICGLQISGYRLPQ